MQRSASSPDREVLLPQHDSMPSGSGVIPAPSERQMSARSRSAEDFFRESYGELIKQALRFGARHVEAEDAASQTLVEACKRWDVLTDPLAWTRKAVVTNLIKVRQSEAKRWDRSIRGGYVTAQGEDDHDFNIWEDNQWVEQML